MPADKYLCFVISPIGASGTDTRRDSDDLLDLIIKPALGGFPFEVKRGDHTQEPNQIQDDVVRKVQQAALCIADISEQNVNVYYEIGRRQETGKPIIFLKKTTSDDIAVDLGNPRYIEYDLDSRSGIRNATKALRSAVNLLVDQGLDQQDSNISLVGISNRLTKIEQKLSQLTSGSPMQSTSNLGGDTFKGSSPLEVFALGARQRNTQMIDGTLDQLRYNTDRVTYLDRYASVAASLGSEKGGAQLLEEAEWFTKEESISFHQKIEYLGCLVSYLNHKDEELTHLEVVEGMCEYLIQHAAHQPAKDIAQIYNQRNRLYHGIYTQTKDDKWLQRAIDNLEIAKQHVPQEGYVYFNLATCYHSMGNIHAAKENVLTAIELDRSHDEDHLFLACRILSELHEKDTPEYKRILAQLEQVSPIRAQLIQVLD